MRTDGRQTKLSFWVLLEMRRGQKNKSILIIHSDSADISMLGQRLKDEGYTVTTARDGRKIIDAVALTNPDLVLVDAENDETSSYQFCELLRSYLSSPYRPIIFIGPENNSLGEMIYTLNMGMDFHVPKPFDIDALVTRIKLAVRLKELCDEISSTNTELSRCFSSPQVHLSGKRISGQPLRSDDIIDVTILFSDIRGFTSLSENMDPSNVFNVLNFYLSIQIDKIQTYHGIIDKLSGDEIMAIFQGPEMAENALRCANSIIRALQDQKTSTDGSWIGVGIGINTGQVYAGSIGSDERKHCTVVGNVVNVAARLCGAAKKFQVLFGETTRKLIEGKGFPYRSIGYVSLKGISAPVEAFEIVDV